jgi:hypothetical protein
LQDLGENIPRIMTSEEWKSQWEAITKQIFYLIKKQKQLIALGIQDEVVESVDDIARQVFEIMHLQNIEFIEWKNRWSDTYLICDEALSNTILQEFWISVWDTIARESWDNTFEYVVKWVGYSKSHRPYEHTKQEAGERFKKVLASGNKIQMRLCFAGKDYPDNWHMIEMSGMVWKEWAFTIDEGDFVYEIIKTSNYN